MRRLPLPRARIDSCLFFLSFFLRNNASLSRAAPASRTSAAAMWFRNALELMPDAGDCAAGEPTMVAMGHCMRKDRRYDEALAWFSRSGGEAGVLSREWSSLSQTSAPEGMFPSEQPSAPKACACANAGRWL